MAKLGLTLQPVSGNVPPGQYVQPGAERRRATVADGQRRRLAALAEVTVQLLQHAVEEESQEASVDDARWALVEQGELHRADAPVAADD